MQTYRVYFMDSRSIIAAEMVEAAIYGVRASLSGLVTVSTSPDASSASRCPAPQSG
jgi:hypothetical protein